MHCLEEIIRRNKEACEKAESGVGIKKLSEYQIRALLEYSRRAAEREQLAIQG